MFTIIATELPRINVNTADYIVIAIYFIAILFCGTWFGRNTKTTKDFFFGGQKFAWWLVAISCIATLVGSYSFINYAERAYSNGFSATMNYTMDWYVIPLFVLAWLPIIYFTRVTSIPEYFEKRFDYRTRMAALFIILVYLVGYIGMNLYTIGVAARGMLGINIYLSAAVVALISAVYMHGGGQTSVIMTDLFQGLILIIAGLLVFAFGIYHLGGFGPFWDNLPLGHRLPFASLTQPKEFHTVGIFWDDAITGTIAFYCMNQGVLMRFMSAKSVRDSTKAIFVVLIIFMPVAALAVCNAGLIGKAMENAGMLHQQFEARHIFVVVANTVCRPGVFGLVMAALIAALMSTLDTYINAVSAIAVNDIWRPIVKPGRSDSYYLHSARYFAIAATILGFALIPFFASFESVAQAFTHFCSTVTPPMIVVITLGALWRRFTPAAAFYTLVVGFSINVASLFFPQMITPFAHGADPSDSYSYMRAFFGVVVSVTIAVIVSLFTKPRKSEEIPGLVLATVKEGMRLFKGGEPDENNAGRKVKGLALEVDDSQPEAIISLSQQEMDALRSKEGDLLYVCDARPWLGGLRSAHVKAGKAHDKPGIARLSSQLIAEGNLLPKIPATVEKIM